MANILAGRQAEVQPPDWVHTLTDVLETPFGRRAFLKGLGALAGASALAGCSTQQGSAPTTSRPITSPKGPQDTSGDVRFNSEGLPIADWVVKENAREGTIDWLVGGTPPGGLEGFLDRVSAQPGDELTLYMNSSGKTLSVKAFRMGWYQGHGARLVADLGSAPATAQPAPQFTPGINMIECHWKPTMRFKVGSDWLPGYYLIRVESNQGWSQWVPLVVRDDTSHAHFVVQSSVTTWQAYNLYGGYSLYLGATPGGGQSYANRSRVVSFDRPYPPGDEDGSADFFGNEYPLVALVERLGLDVTYWTDIDLHARPQLCANHACLVSLGHDEYWSAPMRFGVQKAVNKGLNFAVLGANCCYRHIRLDDSPLGPYRHQVCYKDPTEDPLYGKDNAAVTSNWPSPPDPRPESQLIGIMYQAYGGSGDLDVVDSSHFLFDKTGLSDGSKILNVLGSEFDRYVPGPPAPGNLTILCHSPTQSVIGPSYSDMSYYTVRGGGGVFASGTASFVDRLWDNTTGLANKRFAPGPTPGATEYLIQITKNVLAAFAKGPADRYHPSQANWQHFYAPTSSAPPPVD